MCFQRTFSYAAIILTLSEKWKNAVDEVKGFGALLTYPTNVFASATNFLLQS